MKLLKWTKKAAREAKEGQLFLRLFTSRSGDIALAVVSKDGERISNGNVMVYDNDFRVFVLRPTINNDVPIKTDMVGSPLVYTDIEAREILEAYPNQKLSGMVEVDIGKLNETAAQLIDRLIKEKNKCA